jgi:PhnB protein
MPIEPYLFFEGRCDEALDFYRRALGAEVTSLMRNRESPEPHQPGALPPGTEDKVLHAVVRIGDTTLMVSDGRCSGKPVFQGFALTISAPNVARADQMFAALADGGQVQMALAKTFFSPRFGMVTDRFGVLWMIIVMP